MLEDNLMGCYCNLLVLTQAFEYTTAIIVPVMVCASIETNGLRPIIFILGVKSREIISVTLVLWFVMSKIVLTWEPVLNLVFYQFGKTSDHGFGCWRGNKKKEYKQLKELSAFLPQAQLSPNTYSNPSLVLASLIFTLYYVQCSSLWLGRWREVQEVGSCAIKVYFCSS